MNDEKTKRHVDGCETAFEALRAAAQDVLEAQPRYTAVSMEYREARFAYQVQRRRLEQLRKTRNRALRAWTVILERCGGAHEKLDEKSVVK